MLMACCQHAVSNTVVSASQIMWQTANRAHLHRLPAKLRFAAAFGVWSIAAAPKRKHTSALDMCIQVQGCKMARMVVLRTGTCREFHNQWQRRGRTPLQGI